MTLKDVMLERANDVFIKSPVFNFEFEHSVGGDSFLQRWQRFTKEKAVFSSIYFDSWSNFLQILHWNGGWAQSTLKTGAQWPALSGTSRSYTSH